MKDFQIRDNEAGQRFDKYLSKLLRNAPKSFFYKMLRKKNITLNGKKATGNEKLEAGDQVKLFLSDETFDKFSQQDKAARAVRRWMYFMKMQMSFLSTSRLGCSRSQMIRRNLRW